MKVIKKAELNNWRELELPNLLYKYRTWNDPYHRTIVTNREVFFAEPKSFEDEFDCKIPIRYDLLTERDIYNKYIEDSKEMHPDWSRQQHRKFARDWTDNSPMKDKNRLEEFDKESFEDFNSRFGVLSLTANPVNIEMWMKYADEHNGICVGFDPELMFGYFGGGGEVRYVDELPIIYPTPKHSYEEQSYLQIFNKLRKWEFEEEYRTHKFNNEPMELRERVIQLPPEAYQELIFGANISADTQNEIINNLPDELKEISLKKVNINESEITILPL